MVSAWSVGAMLVGFALDLIFGDPRRFPHIIRLMGAMIAGLEKALRRRLRNAVNVPVVSYWSVS